MTLTNVRIVRIGVCMVVCAVLLAGCGSDKGNNAVLEYYAAALTIEGVPGPGITQLAFDLDGNQLDPPISNAGSGTVSITLSKASFSYAIDLSGVFAVTRAELYLGAPGVRGTRAAVLYSAPAGGVVNGTLIDSVIVSSEVENFTMDEVLSAMINGQAYVQIATTSFPLGQIRGQSAPSGTASLTLGAGSVLYTVSCYLLDSVTSVTLNEGPPGRTGTLRATLYENATGSGTINGDLVSDVFGGTDVLDTTLTYLLDQIRAGNTYINVTTKDAPSGAIRGQVEIVPEE